MGNPFLTSDLLFHEEIHKLVSPVVNLSQVQKTIQEYRNKVLSHPHKREGQGNLEGWGGEGDGREGQQPKL